jgi:hypothetical protein
MCFFMSDLINWPSSLWGTGITPSGTTLWWQWLRHCWCLWGRLAWSPFRRSRNHLHVGGIAKITYHNLLLTTTVKVNEGLWRCQQVHDTPIISDRVISPEVIFIMPLFMQQVIVSLFPCIGNVPNNQRHVVI